MNIRWYLRDLWNDFKAWRRGERRVGPRGKGLKGRIYVRKGASEGVTPTSPHAPTHKTQAKGNATLTLKIMRKDGTTEVRTVPGTVVTNNLTDTN